MGRRRRGEQGGEDDRWRVRRRRDLKDMAIDRSIKRTNASLVLSAAAERKDLEPDLIYLFLASP